MFFFNAIPCHFCCTDYTGTVLEFSREDFDRVLGPSPHYAGLPEVLSLAKHLEITFPEEIRVLALEIADCCDFRETLSPPIEQALPIGGTEDH